MDKRLVYMTPEWKDAFLLTTKLADQLGMEEAIAGSPGWSESGGPWVKPSQGMKKVVWSETRIEGGKPFPGALPHPPTVTGPLQNIPIFDFLAMISGQPTAPPTFYADTAVIAYRAPAGLPKIKNSSIATVESPWDLTFQADRGAPAKITLDKSKVVAVATLSVRRSQHRGNAG